MKHAIIAAAIIILPLLAPPARAEEPTPGQLYQASYFVYSAYVRAGAADRSSRGEPEEQSCDEKKKCKEGQERVGNLKPITKERRPELGSLLFALGGIPVAFIISGIGDDLRCDGRRWWGGLCVCAGILLAFQSTIGFVFGFDLWSLLRLL